jgi:hypothetical protein
MRRSSAYAWCAVAIALAAAVAIALTQRAAPNFPVSDLAVSETYTILASQGRLLVGPYSRFSWHHPGPIYFYLLVPFYKLLGNRTLGLEVGALAINLCSMAAAMLIASRVGSRRYLVATCAAFLFFALRFQPALTSIWNPHVIAIPAMALVTSAVGALSGSAIALLAASTLSSFVTQTHVGTAPVALFLAGLAVAGALALPRPTPADQHRRWLTVAAAVLVAAVCWVPTLVEQVRGPEHNLSALWRYFTSTSSPHGWLPVGAAWAFALSGGFRTDYKMPIGTPIVVSHASITLLMVCVGLGGLAFGSVRCWVVQQRRGAIAMFLPLGVCAIALLSLHRVAGSIDDHVVFWLSGIGVLGVASLLARCGSSQTMSHRVVEPLIAALPALVIAVVAAAGLLRLANAADSSAIDRTSQSVATRELTAAIETYLDSSHAKPFIKVDQAAWEVTAGVALQLQRTRRPFAIEPEWLDMFTKVLGPDGTETAGLTIAGPDLTHVLSAAPGARVLRSTPQYSAIVTPLR